VTDLLLGLALASASLLQAAGPDLQESVAEARERAQVVNVDQEARHKRSMRLANSALQAYERYVSRFGDWPQSYAIHLRYAQLLFDLDEWTAANREFRRAVEVSPHGDHSEYAARMRMVTSNNTNDCGAFVDRRGKLPACAQEELDALNMYLRYFGHTEEAIKAKFRRGMFFQYYERLRDAADDFTDILRTHDGDEIGRFAAAHLLQCLTDSGRAAEARQWAQIAKSKPKLMTDLEVRIAVAQALGEPVPPRPRTRRRPGRPPDVIPGPPNNPIFLADPK
jgi:hypothetical protein